MRIPYRVLTVFLAALLVPAPGSAQDHVVSVADVQARLAEAADERAANLRVVEAALASPAAAEAATLLHADLDRVRRGAGSLTNAELRDVAARAQLLTVDPVAAGPNPVLLVLAVVGAAVVLLFVLLLILCATGTCGD